MADNERDEHGRFAAGNHPVTGFHTNPERRGRFPGNRHSFSKAAQRLLDMTDSQLEAERKRTDLTQAERIALNMLDRATDTQDPQQLAAFKQLMDRTEGKPRTAAEEPAAYEPPIINIRFCDDNPGNHAD